MARRIKAAINDLTAETVAFRESADRAAERSDVADRRLARLTNLLIGFTVLLVLLTGVIAWLTIVLVRKG